jgi:hypothetical protein
MPAVLDRPPMQASDLLKRRGVELTLRIHAAV